MEVKAGDIGWVQTKNGTRHSRWSSVLHYVRGGPVYRAACMYSTPWTVTWREAKLTGKCATCVRLMEPGTSNN